MIPKFLHYCWFGGKPKGSLVEECITSWQKILPDYEIKEWNESNCNFDSCLFIKEAFEHKKWAFVADYIRVEKLYQYGGVYFDTDVLLLKGLDGFLNLQGFLGAESPTSVNGAVMGFQPKNPFLTKLLLSYQQIQSIDWNNLEELIIPYLITKNLNLAATVSFNEIVDLDTLIVYPPEYFYPLPFSKKAERKSYKKFLTSNSYAVHLWESSWIEDPSEFYLIENRLYFKAFLKILKRVSKREQQLTMRYLKKVIYTISKI